MKAPVETIVVAGKDAGLRLDRWFKLHFPTVGHSYLQKLLRTGQVRLDSKRVEAGGTLRFIRRLFQCGKSAAARPRRSGWSYLANGRDY